MIGALVRAFDTKGTANRRHLALVLAISLIVSVYGETLRADPERTEAYRWFVPFAGVVGALFLAILFKRLNEIDRSTAWTFLYLVPVANILLTIYLLTRRGLPQKREPGQIAVLLGRLAVISLFLLGISTFFWRPFFNVSGNMVPTLLIGDYLIMNYKPADDLERGDVVVFLHPQSREFFVKRLIGLPNENIQMRDGLLYINDVPVEVEKTDMFMQTFEPQGPHGMLPQCMNGTVGLGGDCMAEQWIETLPNGVRHNVLNVGDQALDNTAVFTVPPGHYFFMGDNRDNSTDSRVRQNVGGVGFVPFEDIVGRADRIMFSSAGRSMLAFWTWRGDRFFKAVE
jgi:signal peptidase I